MAASRTQRTYLHTLVPASGVAAWTDAQAGFGMNLVQPRDS